MENILAFGDVANSQRQRWVGGWIWSALFKFFLDVWNFFNLQGPLAPIHIGHMHAPQVSASDSLNVTETEYSSHGLHPIRISSYNL